MVVHLRALAAGVRRSLRLNRGALRRDEFFRFVRVRDDVSGIWIVTMEIPEVLAPELFVLGSVVLRSLVALTSVARVLHPHRWRDAHARLRAQLEPPMTIPRDFPGRTMWGPILHA